MQGMLMFAAISSVLLLSNVPAGQQPPQQGNICIGNECSAEFVAFPRPNWMIVPTSLHNGKGDGDEPCDPCKSCKARVTWAYFGATDWMVTHGEDIVFGHGPAGGVLDLETGCDEIPDGATLTDPVGGTFNVDLYCPCY
ncbi:MAG: hypothetical protein HOP15_18385 [Planctomycetes bacterium]|nr:hypothetical protein [Planctomycetota bacterium]